MFLKEIQWENSTTKIKELTDLFIMDKFPSTLGNSLYYVSYYICPDCNKHLLYKIKIRGVKTVFEGETKDLFNIFTCPVCKRFYASIASSTNSFYTSTRLSDFALRSISYKNDEYNYLIGYTQSF